jgi:hypothetical protein
MDEMRSRFYGTWTLVSVEREDANSGSKLDADTSQAGYITYSEPRVTVITQRVGGVLPSDISAYVAAWHVDGDTVYHDVEISTRAEWTGTRQIRQFKFDGKRLTLTPPTSPDYTHKINTKRSLTWERL